MLSERERRLLEDIERSLAADVERHPLRPLPRWRGAVRHWRWGWAAVALIGSVSLFLMMEGAGNGGMALALAAVLCWLLWRYRPLLRALGNPALLSEDDGAGNGPAPIPR